MFEKLSKHGFEIVFFSSFGYVNRFGPTVLRNSLPRVYGDFLDNKIVLCVASSEYKKLCKTTRVQIFHGLGSFGALWQRNFIDPFDVLFIVTRFQWRQLEEEIKKMVEKNGYKTEREKFRGGFVFNLGKAADVAVSKIKDIHGDL